MSEQIILSRGMSDLRKAIEIVGEHLYHHEGATLATDRKMLIRLDAQLDCDERFNACVNRNQSLDKLLNTFELGNPKSFTPLSEYLLSEIAYACDWCRYGKRIAEICSHCNSTVILPCPACAGSNEAPNLICDPARISNRYYAILKLLPACELSPGTNESDPILIQFNGGRGVVMGLR